jgi:hypothetical protein
VRSGERDCTAISSPSVTRTATDTADPSRQRCAIAEDREIAEIAGAGFGIGRALSG